jgi:hypothetical protein
MSAGLKAPDRRDAELRALRTALKATILNMERLVEEAERTLRRANETSDALRIEYGGDNEEP